MLSQFMPRKRPMAKATRATTTTTPAAMALPEEVLRQPFTFVEGEAAVAAAVWCCCTRAHRRRVSRMRTAGFISH